MQQRRPLRRLAAVTLVVAALGLLALATPDGASARTTARAATGPVTGPSPFRLPARVTRRR